MKQPDRPSPVRETSPVVEFPVPPLPVGVATCDRCAAYAYYRIAIDAAKQHWLDFCRHHFRFHEVHIMLNGYDFEDQSCHIAGRKDEYGS